MYRLSKSNMFILYKLRALLFMIIVIGISNEDIHYPLDTSSFHLRIYVLKGNDHVPQG